MRLLRLDSLVRVWFWVFIVVLSWFNLVNLCVVSVVCVLVFNLWLMIVL